MRLLMQQTRSRRRMNWLRKIDLEAGRRTRQVWEAVRGLGMSLLFGMVGSQRHCFLEVWIALEDLEPVLEACGQMN